MDQGRAAAVPVTQVPTGRRRIPSCRSRPAEEAKTFILPTGYRMELVASDPDIIMPAAMEWDGNGRLFVVELRTYMLDADGKDKYKPISRISMWESTKGDGKYDKHTVFVDNLVLPRMVLPLDGNSILTNETETHDVVKWTDTNGDGVADKRELFYTGVGPPGQQPRAPAERVRLGHGQLDLQHLQRLPLPLDAEGHPARADRRRTAASGACRRTPTARCGSWTRAANAAR